MTHRSLFLLSLVALTIFSCARKSGENSARGTRAGDGAMISNGESRESSTDGNGTLSGWYYFSKEGIHTAASPSAIPSTGFVPWTEATRVADMTEIDGKPAFLINRLGVMIGGDGATLYRLPEAYASSSVGGFVREDGQVGLRVYRNTTFSDADSSFLGPFLVRFFPETGRFDPWAFPRELGANPESNCVALDRIGSMWYASFKHERDSRVEFLYLELERLPVASSDGERAPARVISADSWRSAVRPFSVSEMTEPLAGLFSSIPKTVALSVRARSPDAPTVQTWTREGTGEPIQAEAIVSGTHAAALFSDGTFVVFAGTGARAFTLPRLSSGYSYGCFMITGSTLLASWEERRFFETGRAGLLEITLPDGVYW